MGYVSFREGNLIFLGETRLLQMFYVHDLLGGISQKLTDGVAYSPTKVTKGSYFGSSS